MPKIEVAFAPEKTIMCGKSRSPSAQAVFVGDCGQISETPSTPWGRRLVNLPWIEFAANEPRHLARWRGEPLGQRPRGAAGAHHTRIEVIGPDGQRVIDLSDAHTLENLPWQAETIGSVEAQTEVLSPACRSCLFT